MYIRGHPWSSHPWSSVVIRGHPWSSHPWSSVVIRGHPWSSVVIRGHPWSSVVIPSVVIRGYPWSSYPWSSVVQMMRVSPRRCWRRKNAAPTRRVLLHWSGSSRFARIRSFCFAFLLWFVRSAGSLLCFLLCSLLCSALFSALFSALLSSLLCSLLCSALFSALLFSFPSARSRFSVCVRHLSVLCRLISHELIFYVARFFLYGFSASPAMLFLPSLRKRRSTTRTSSISSFRSLRFLAFSRYVRRRRCSCVFSTAHVRACVRIFLYVDWCTRVY